MPYWKRLQVGDWSMRMTSSMSLWHVFQPLYPIYRLHPIHSRSGCISGVGTWIWLGYTIKHDTASIRQPAISQFQHLFVSQKPQQRPLLNRYAAILLKTYNFQWNQLAIDSIVTSLLHLIWTCVLEPKPIYKSMSVLPGGQLWPATICSGNRLGRR